MIATLAAAASLLQAATAAETARPNIVFIFSDDHAYQAIGAYGDPRQLLETPNIDRVAAEGMRFDRCLVTNSICGPSRATILTGKYSHANGFYNNTNNRFDGSQVTFPKLLRQAGYQTALFGKWHLGSEPTGFDEWQILPGQGVYYNPPMLAPRGKVQHQGYVTDIITDLSLDWLKRRDRSRPFVLMCQHKAPHREWEPALRHLGHDGDRVYPEPSTLFDDYAGRGRAEHDQDMTIARTMTERDLKLVPPAQLDAEQRRAWDAYYEPRNKAFREARLEGKDLVRWKYNRYLHDYLGCIKAVDESVGRILSFLDEEGLASNTLVVYASDQGFYLGEHGWFDKRWIFEESLRTPLVARWPGVVKPGSKNARMVSNVDLAETFLDAAGAPVPAEMQGRSLVPLLRGEDPADWRTSFYYHYYEFPGPHDVARHYGVVTDRYKLVHFYEPAVDSWELFDLATDPLELKSVYGRPEVEVVQHQLEAELKRLRADLKVPAVDPPEAAIGKAASQPRPRGNAPEPTAHVTDWFKDAKLGVFMHFLPGSPAQLEQVKAFNVDALARQLKEIGAGYFVLTLGQNSGYFNAPNAVYDRVAGYAPGERLSTRDLPLDLARALAAQGIKLMLYLPCQTPNRDAKAQKAFGIRPEPADQRIDLEFARKWAEVIREWSDRYGDKVAGWWFDGGYEWVGFNESIAQVYSAAAKHGNPKSIVTFNPGVKLIRWTKAEDYTAGELDQPFKYIPSSRWVDGSQWHALTFLGSSWGKRETRFPPEQWAAWAREAVGRGGVVTLDMGPNWDPSAGPIGSLAEPQLHQAKAIARALGKVDGTPGTK